MPYKIRKIKCKKADGSSGTHVAYKKSGKRVGCTDDPEDYKKALYAAELNEQEENEEAIIKDVEDEVFLHFTTRERAEKIKDMEMLLKSPQDVQKFGTDTIDAVSLIWGEFVPTVQVNHILGEDIVAVKFRTHHPPKYGFVEEVKWDQEELPIYDIDIISFEEAERALKNTSEKYDDMQQILYKESNMRKLKLKDPLPNSKYQKKVRKGHKKKKKELIGSGDGPESSPFTQDPPFERSKSAPPLGEGKKKKKKKRKVKVKKKSKGKDDRCTRIAKRKYDVWPSAYASGAVVKCRQGKIWKGITEELDKKEKSEIKKIQKELGNASESHKKLADIMSELEDELDALEDKFEVELEKAAEKMKAGSKAHADQVKRLDKIIQEEVEAFLMMEKKKKKKKAKKKVKTDFSKEKDKGLHGWFERQGGKGKSKGWVDCNTCRKDKKTGKKTCKTCGRQEGEKRAKYPSCRPTPAACGSKGKGKSWGKKSAKKGKKK